MAHPKVDDYDKVVEFLENGFEEVSGDTFYSEIFPNNEDIWEKNDHYQKPNAIYLYYDENKDRMRRRIMFNDTWVDDYNEFVVDNPMTLCSGLSYRGRRNRLENAQKLHALIFDLDSVGFREFQNLFYQFGKAKGESYRPMAMPTYIVVSGSGLHLYYLMDDPIDLYPNIKLQLKQMKYEMTRIFWDPGTTTKEETVQYQGIAQGFRMVGSVNNKHGNFRIRAFRTGKPVSLELLNSYLVEKFRVDLNYKFHPTSCSLKEARLKWPEWYEKRIIGGQKRGQWMVKDDLYKWWLRQLQDESKIVGGHRYFYLMCLAIYAVKCGISKKQLRQDMKAVFPVLVAINHENEFTQKDIESALEAYDKGYYCFTRDDISKLSGVPITANKRNGRPQKLHLAGARAIQDINDKFNGTNWRKGNGRKPKALTVYEWRQSHPEGRKIDCERALGLSRHTVLKWWDWRMKGEE